MQNANKYYLKLKKRPLPKEKPTELDWKTLVALISKRGIRDVAEIYHWNKDVALGQRKVNRSELFALWKAVGK